ncbi:MAG: amino acid permease [Nocardioidaceae bacterium]|nr:amino acid permease [Nocardioidaceae bacterium]
MTLTPGSPAPSFTAQIFRRKPIEPDGDEGSGLERTIGLWQLVGLGVGATVGTGIFFVLSEAVPDAGPAVIISFVIAAITAGLTALCYAELASSIPVSGSTYSYAYATLGEVVAMGVAACLLLEYGVSSAAVSVGWSQYLNQFIGNVTNGSVQIPEAIASTENGVVNLPAMVLVVLCALLLVRGASESAKANVIMVGIKLGVLTLFVCVGATGWNSDNLSDFAPFGVAGVNLAAATIFFSFIGLDAVSTAGNEVKDAKKTMPLAIVISLAIVSTVYIAVAVVGVAAQPYDEFEGQEAGLAQILQNVVGASWPGTVLAAGAIISIFSVTLVTLYGQTRILFSMGRDRMLPPVFASVSRRTRTPVNNTIIVAVVVGLLAGLVPLDSLIDLTSIGTLVAFSVVSIAVILLRVREPDMERGFRVPGYPVTPVLAILACAYVLAGLHWVTWVYFGAWVAAMLVFYFLYGYKHSRLREDVQS